MSKPIQTDVLQQLLTANPDVARIMNKFEAADDVYERALRAMGGIRSSPNNSASTQITIAVDQMPSATIDWSSDRAEEE